MDLETTPRRVLQKKGKRHLTVPFFLLKILYQNSVVNNKTLGKRKLSFQSNK